MNIDQFRDTDLVIDLHDHRFIQKPFVSKGDVNGRTLTVVVTDNGAYGQIAGLELNLLWKNMTTGLADLTAFEKIEAETSKFRIIYPEHMLTPGTVRANIQVLQGGSAINLRTFELNVQNIAGEIKGAIGSSEFTALTAALAQTNRFETDIEDLGLNKAEKIVVDNLAHEVGTGLDDLSQKKAEKTDVDYLANKKVDKNGASQVTWNMIAQDARDQIGGNKPAAIVGKDAVGDENIIDGAISAKKIEPGTFQSFFAVDQSRKIREELLLTKDPSKNLFIYETIKLGVYDIDGKETTASAAAWCSDYMRVPPNTDIYCDYLINTNAGALYDENLKFITRIPAPADSGAGYFNTGSAQYIRINGWTGYVSSRFVVSIGQDKPESFSYAREGGIEGLMVDASQIVGHQAPEMIAGINFKNLFDPKSATTGMWLRDSGKYETANDLSYSRMIKVSPGITYGQATVYGESGGWFDSQGRWLAPLKLTEVTTSAAAIRWWTQVVPERAQWVVTNVRPSHYGWFMCRLSDTPPDKFYEYVAEADWLVERANTLNDKKVFVAGDSISWNDGQTQNGEKLIGWQQELRYMGAIVNNDYSLSGQTLRKYKAEWSNVNHDSFYTHYVADDEFQLTDYDYLVISLGTNDLARASHKSQEIFEQSIGDINSTDSDTTLGALNLVIAKAVQENPDIKIRYLCPIYSADAWRSWQNLELITQKITECCRQYGVPAKSMIYECGINKLNYQVMLYDKVTHPNNRGYRLMGAAIRDFLMSK